VVLVSEVVVVSATWAADDDMVETKDETTGWRFME